MDLKTTLIAACGAFLIAAGTAMASPSEVCPKKAAMIKTFDADGDGKLSKAEWAQAKAECAKAGNAKCEKSKAECDKAKCDKTKAECNKDEKADDPS